MTVGVIASYNLVLPMIAIEEIIVVRTSVEQKIRQFSSSDFQKETIGQNCVDR